MRSRRDLTLAAVATALSAAAWGRYGWEPALGLLGAAAVVALLVPPLTRTVRRLRLLARPSARGVHQRATPLLGGAAVCVPLCAYLAWRAAHGDEWMLGLLVATVLMLLLGIVDDVRGVRPRVKVIVQILAALALLTFGHRLETISVGGLGAFEPDLLGIPLLVVWVLLVTNAFNIVDGLDGLATTLALLAALGLALGGVDAGAAAVLAGACLGFLRTNLPRARIFLGDSGSLVLGMWVASLTLELPSDNNLVLALALTAYPLGDVSLALLRRAVRGKPLFAADRSHIHHKALAHLGSARRALLAITAFAGAQLAVAFLLPGVATLLVLAAGWVALVLLLITRGRVRVGLVWRARRDFQRLHLVHDYVEGLLRLAESPAHVERALQVLGEELGLAQIELGELRVDRRDRGAAGARVEVALRGGVAAWRHATPPPPGDALTCEVHVVLAALLQLAATRLARLSAPPLSPLPPLGPALVEPPARRGAV